MVTWSGCLAVLAVGCGLAACGGAVGDSVEGDSGPVVCFPALTDCRSDGGCREGRVCVAVVPECTAAYSLCRLPGVDANERIGECDPATLQCVDRNVWP